MPPKAKKGGKKGDGGGKGNAVTPLEPVDPGAEPETSAGAKEVHERELAIQRLKTQLGEFQDASCSLDIQVEGLRDAVRGETSDALDVRNYLSLELVKAENVLSSLASEVHEAEQSVVAQNAQIELRLKEASDTAETATTDIAKKLKAHDLEAEKQRVREKERNELLASIDAVSETLATESRMRRSEITKLEGEALSEKGNLAKAHEILISDKSAQLTRATDEQLIVTTKRAIIRNEERGDALSKQSVVVEKAIEKHEKALQSMKRSIASRDVSRETTVAAKRRSEGLLKAIGKCKEQIAEVEHERRNFPFKVSDKAKDLKFATIEVGKKESDLIEFKRQAKRVETRLQETKKRLQETKKRLAEQRKGVTQGVTGDSSESIVSLLVELLEDSVSFAAARNGLDGNVSLNNVTEDSNDMRIETLDILCDMLQERAQQLRSEKEGDGSVDTVGGDRDGRFPGDGETLGISGDDIPSESSVPDAVRVMVGMTAVPIAKNLPAIPSFEQRMANWGVS